MLEAARAGNGGGVSEEEFGVVKTENESLKAQLEEANAALEAAKAAGDSGGGDSELQAQVDQVTRERDELKERLMEYEIIEEDLANLKKFQQENEQLKKTIAELKGGAPAEDAPADEAPAPTPTPEPEPAAEEAPAAEPEPAAEEPAAEAPPETTGDDNPAADDSATEAAAEENPEVPANEGEQKSAAELLSEFEKMLG
jgi:TolA-binding protein